MGLTLVTGKKLLRQIVGGNGSFSGGNLTPYLALSSEKPLHAPDPVSGTYNVVEPGAGTSYARVQLGAGYFGTDPAGHTDPETGNYVISITNDTEIHFPEALQDWGAPLKYFAIFETKNGTIPTYVGELDSYTRAEDVVDVATFEEAKDELYVLDEETGKYVKVEAADTYDVEATYARKELVVKQGTVPLVRAGYLTISVE